MFLKTFFVSCLFLSSLTSGSSCLNLKSDCGAKGDNSGTNDSPAFTTCEKKASITSTRCVEIPSGEYEVIGVQLTASNMDWRFQPNTIFRPWRGMTSCQSMFAIGTSTGAFAQNISFGSQYPHKVTIDASKPLLVPWKVRGIQATGVTQLVLKNIDLKMANNWTDPSLPCSSAVPAIGFDCQFNPENKKRYFPSHGHVVNITSTGGIFGYGLTQVQSASDFLFENLDGTGGVTLRLETGYGCGHKAGTPMGFVGNIQGKNVICRDGHAAFMSQPHTQVNGKYAVENVMSFGCGATVNLEGGYEQNGKPPGVFSNDSTIHGVTGVYGTHAQMRKDKEDVPACSVCHATHLNYVVTVKDIVSKGYPPPSNRTKCVPYGKYPWPTCPFSK